MRTVVEIMQEEIERASSASSVVADELASELRILKHKGELTDVAAYKVVTEMIQRRAGTTSDLYTLAERVYETEWLCKVLRLVSESFYLRIELTPIPIKGKQP
jgi:hypothetical protein